MLRFWILRLIQVAIVAIDTMWEEDQSKLSSSRVVESGCRKKVQSIRRFDEDSRGASHKRESGERCDVAMQRVSLLKAKCS